MRRLAVIVALASCALLAPKSLAAQGKGTQVALDQLPQAVISAIEAAYPKSALVTALKISRGAETRYAITLKQSPDAAPITIMAMPDGQIRAGKPGAQSARTMPPSKSAAKPRSAKGSTQYQTIAIEQLPKEVTKAIKSAYPKDTITGAIKLTSGAEVLYQLTLDDVASIAPLTVVVSADGKFQKR
jgi:putative PepSY-like beta-lactamase-inhibitor